VVEWGDVAEPVLGRDAVSVCIGPGPSEAERDVTIAASGRWSTRWVELTGVVCGWATP
jgi:hypothetical protein